jgi:hemin uptake protein HemP
MSTVLPQSQVPAPKPDPASAPASKRAAAEPPRIQAQTLFGVHRELVIEHDGALYRLRITQHNKLILTK